MAVAIPMLMIAGAAIAAVGATQTAQAQKTAGLYNARQSEQNAQIALDQSSADAARFAVQSRRREGSMIAAFGGTGLTAEGTESILADSASQARLDEETIKYKGRLQSIGYYNSATLDRFGADTAVKQGDMRAASSILSGAGQAGATYVAGGSRLRQGPANSSTGGGGLGYDDY